MSKSDKKSSVRHEHKNKYANLVKGKSSESKRQESKSKQVSTSAAATPVNAQP